MKLILLVLHFYKNKGELFVKLNLPISKLCGQCNDGCSPISGVKTGVSKRILEEVLCLHTAMERNHVLCLHTAMEIRLISQLLTRQKVASYEGLHGYYTCDNKAD